jgi:hypothetical protein
VTEYWGKPRDCDSKGHRLQRWKIRKWHSKSGPTTIHVWQVFEPSGQWTGTFESWDEAMAWATSITPHIEQWLANQKESK